MPTQNPTKAITSNKNPLPPPLPALEATTVTGARGTTGRCEETLGAGNGVDVGCVRGDVAGGETDGACCGKNCFSKVSAPKATEASMSSTAHSSGASSK